MTSADLRRYERSATYKRARTRFAARFTLNAVSLFGWTTALTILIHWWTR